MHSISDRLWNSVQQTRREQFEGGHPILARCATELADLALIVFGIGEAIIQGLGIAISFLLCSIDTQDKEWMQKCFTWMEHRTLGAQESLTSTCSAVIQLFTNPFSGIEDQNLNRHRASIVSCLDSGC